MSHQHLIEDYAERIDVGARVNIRRLRTLLGRHVLRRADNEVGRSQAGVVLTFRLLNLRDAKIQHLRIVGP